MNDHHQGPTTTEARVGRPSATAEGPGTAAPSRVSAMCLRDGWYFPLLKPEDGDPGPASGGRPFPLPVFRFTVEGLCVEGCNDDYGRNQRRLPRPYQRAMRRVDY